jgi:acyl-CoA synthetase (AMP-forming)/AMP-acid ligase II
MPLGEESVGEIWIRGDNVTQGYWQKPRETEATFAARTAAGEGPYLRSGDLGFVHEGELFITGRIKDLIIVRGRNHYPQDIEQTVEASYPSIRRGCSAAFSIHAEGEERLVVVAEVEQPYRFPEGQEFLGTSDGNQGRSRKTVPFEFTNLGPDRMLPFAPESIIGAIRAAVSTIHGVPVYAVALVSAKTIAKTSSGKIQRFECRRAFQSGTLVLLAHRSDPESIRDLSAINA